MPTHDRLAATEDGSRSSEPKNGSNAKGEKIIIKEEEGSQGEKRALKSSSSKRRRTTSSLGTTEQNESEHRKAKRQKEGGRGEERKKNEGRHPTTGRLKQKKPDLEKDKHEIRKIRCTDRESGQGNVRGKSGTQTQAVLAFQKRKSDVGSTWSLSPQI